MIYSFLSYMAWFQQQREEQVYLPKIHFTSYKLTHTAFPFPNKTKQTISLKTLVPEELINQSSHLWLLRDLCFRE